MLTVSGLNNAMKWLANGLFLVLAFCLYLPSVNAADLVPGCTASAPGKDYGSGFVDDDFVRTNVSLTNGRFVLDTGDIAINPNSIIIPFDQDVAVTFISEYAGFGQNDFGWILATDPTRTKHQIYQDVNDNNDNGVLDSREGIDANGDGVVNVLDNRVVMGHFAAGTELVFYLNVDQRSYTCYTKTAWNTDTFSSFTCAGSANFVKTFKLGSATNTFSKCGPSSWLDSGTVNRLKNTPLNLDFCKTVAGVTTCTEKTISITGGANFPHVMVGASDSKPNEWILGWEDLPGGDGGLDYDLNDMVFRIDRQTGGNAQLQSAAAIIAQGVDAHFTAVTIDVYDIIPCSGGTIKYFLSIKNGDPGTWVEITAWDLVETLASPAGATHRKRRVDFRGSANVGNTLVWKAEMFSPIETCKPEIIDVKIDGTVATWGFFSRASPSVQTNMLYSGNYESPKSTWGDDDQVLHGHLIATRLYDPADTSKQAIAQKWDAGEVLKTRSPSTRKIIYPKVSTENVTREPLGLGDGIKTQFSGTLDHYPISATTVTITDSLDPAGGFEIFHDKHTNVLEGNKGGTGTINRFTGAYDLYFNTAPGPNMPIVASYTYYTSTVMEDFTTANINNTMLGLDNSTYIDSNGTHYKYDFTTPGASPGVFNEDDGDWLVGWVRGFSNGTSTAKKWLLGPIDHSVPAVETPPPLPSWYLTTKANVDMAEAEAVGPDPDCKVAVAEERARLDAFDQFLFDQYKRPTVIYVGSRDGMIHAFDGGKFRWGYYIDKYGSKKLNPVYTDKFEWGNNPDTTITEYRGYFESGDYGMGEELWAFIPANLIPRLKNNFLSGEDQAFVDASPTVADVEIYISNKWTWKTILLSAEGEGGDTVFCLEVTDPLNPKFMWEFADPDLFRSRSSPSVAVIGQTIHNGTRKWVAFFVSGKNDNNSMLPVDDIHRYPSIYMIDIADGSVLERIFLNSEPNGINGIPSGQPAVVDSDGNGYIDRIYIGTDKGYLYKVTIPDCPSKLSTYGITNCVINTDIGSAARNPIYASPAVVVQNTINDRAEIKDYMIKIMFGTSDSPYYDDNLPGPYHFFAYVDTAKKTDTCNSSKVTLDWLYQLPAGERIFASAFAAAGAVYFGTATSETTDPCEGSGNPASNLGRLYVMNIKQTGQTGSPTPKFTKDTGNILTAPVVDDQNLYVKTLFGMFTTGNPYNNPGVGPVGTSVTTWREIFSKDQTLVPSPTPSP